MGNIGDSIDLKRDLVLERSVELPTDVMWAAWTKAENLSHWFAPKPWTSRCSIDIKPGGAFNVTLISPTNDEVDIEGCVLEVVDGRRLVWTCGLTEGFRPAPSSDDPMSVPFTAVIELSPERDGTKYRVIARHADEESCIKHRDMGFHGGWGAALDQLIEHMKGQ
ncbi:MAG: SRPBCC domain-containing protein [Planctomycetota bacterium]|nr:SRPBCC domain-containing protein [Planctomycetota bacterium]